MTSSEGWSVNFVFPTEVIYKDRQRTVLIGMGRLPGPILKLAIFVDQMNLETWDGPAVQDDQLKKNVLARVSAAAARLKIQLEVG